MQSKEEQVRGCLLAGCVGDAFASGAEGRFYLDKTYQPDWKITDDTQMTIATCDAIVASGKPSAQSIAHEFLEWFQADRLTGLGSITLGALRSLNVGAHWALSGIEGQRASGAGGAMRVAPLAFVLDVSDFSQKQMLRDIVRITHKNEEALAGAQAVVSAIQYLLKNPNPKQGQLLEFVVDGVFDSQTRDNIQRLLTDGVETYEDAAMLIGTSGFVAHSVPVALSGVQRGAQTDFDELLWQIVLAGGDTDTIASLAGQFVGCAAGPSCIPSDFCLVLEQNSWVEQSVSSFAHFVQDTT